MLGNTPMLAWARIKYSEHDKMEITHIVGRSFLEVLNMSARNFE